MMKEIKAIIRPFTLTNVIEALRQIEWSLGITVREHVHTEENQIIGTETSRLTTKGTGVN